MYTQVKNLLSKGATNAKTAKNSLETYILYLAPHKQNSKKINICPKAAGCAAACLYSAGRGKFSNVQKSRINKTEFLLHDKELFILQLAKELTKINSKAKDKIAIRLNGTSDLDFIYLLKKYAALDIKDLKNLIFYDYTKIPGKAKKYLNDKNYIVTFSRDETNAEYLPEFLKLGINVSVVFSGDLPKTYLGFKVIDGDKSDIVMLENKGVILGLRAKGDAKKDTTGFVVHAKEKPVLEPYLSNQALQQLNRPIEELSSSEYTTLKNEQFLNINLR